MTPLTQAIGRRVGILEGAARAFDFTGALNRPLFLPRPADELAVPELQELAARFTESLADELEAGGWDASSQALDAPPTQLLVARTLVNKGSWLSQVGQPRSAIAAFDELVARYGGATEPAIQDQVAQALLKKGSLLVQLGQVEAATATYEEAAVRVGLAEPTGDWVAEIAHKARAEEILQSAGRHVVNALLLSDPGKIADRSTQGAPAGVSKVQDDRVQVRSR